MKRRGFIGGLLAAPMALAKAKKEPEVLDAEFIDAPTPAPVKQVMALDMTACTGFPPEFQEEYAQKVARAYRELGLKS